MRKCEVAVLGLGLMGGAALGALLDAGVDALGFDPVGAGSDRGSSHGSCRISVASISRIPTTPA